MISSFLENGREAKKKGITVSTNENTSSDKMNNNETTKNMLN